MTTIVRELCKGVSALFTAAEIAKYLRSEDRELEMKQPIALTRAIGVTAAVSEVGARLLGASNATLKNVKNVEFYAKVFESLFNFNITPYEEAILVRPSRPVLINFLVNKILAPAMSVLRLKGEYMQYEQKAYLDMPPKEFAKQFRKEPSESGWKNIPLTKEECKAELQKIEKDLPAVTIAETVLKTYTLFSTETYLELGKWLSAFAENFGLGGADDPFDLLHLAVIPENLHADPVFAAHICPITLCPIRHPVGDPNGVTIYERAAIVEALAHDPRSPMTHEPLHVEDLIPQPGLQETIDAQLRTHEARLRREMAARPAH